jgi:ubiquinone/menaquinone biosynthesis C-methylase UbiE
MAQYQFDHAWQQERARLASLEEFEDPGTIRHLEALGVGPGWRCLELGAGGGSIAAWLCQRVGPAGHVLATDLETKFLAALDAPNLEVRRHDITTDDLPEGAFDLIHERAVLLHIPTRQAVLARLARALKPGGWLLCEDTDFATLVEGAPVAAIRRVGAAMVAFLESRGADPNYGRRLYGDLRAAGLAEVGAAGRVYMMQGGHPSAVLPRYTFERVRAPAVAGGLAGEAEFDAALAALADPMVTMMSHVMMAVWGRRPAR